MTRRTAPRGPDPAAAGFTLLEIMVVMVILAVLGAMIVPNIMGRPDEARLTAAQNDLRSIANSLNMYRLDNFRYPTTDQGLAALVEAPDLPPEPRNWNPEGYLPKVPEDPWGSPYQYLSNGETFELYSLGADGVEGGEGNATDLYYRDL